jgi:hypothetical protein
MIYIPTEHYVGIQQQNLSSPELLGFITPYANDAAFAKRKITIDSWVDGYQNKLPKGHPQRFTRILKNELSEGFEISRSVRRYGWNGGNVVWRVIDPRGFELEISSANFASIINCTMIDNGVIKGRCIWGRDGATNILLPENSEPYQEAIKRKTTLVPIKQLVSGMKIQLQSGIQAEYLGKFYCINYTNDRNYESVDKVVERHFYTYAGVITNSINIKVTEILDDSNTLTLEQATDRLRPYLPQTSLVYIQSQKFTSRDITATMEPTSITNVDMHKMLQLQKIYLFKRPGKHDIYRATNDYMFGEKRLSYRIIAPKLISTGKIEYDYAEFWATRCALWNDPYRNTYSPSYHSQYANDGVFELSDTLDWFTLRLHIKGMPVDMLL